MRRLISLLIFLSIFDLARAQEVKFSDLPENHWAGTAVYDLVKKGVTNGFPDGTFRGMDLMSRYETASYLSKIAEISPDWTETGRLVEELRTELQTTKYEIENPETLKLSGRFQERIRLGNEFLNPDVPNGPRVDYRLNLTGERDFGPNRYLKIHLDTMDSGFNGGTSDLASKLLDVEGKIKLGSIDLKAAAGPGPVIHRETDGIIPSDDYYVYDRPKFNASLSESFGSVNLSGAYVSRNVQPWGEVGVNEMTVTGAFTYHALPLLGKTRIALTPRYLWADAGHDLRGEYRGRFRSSPHPLQPVHLRDRQ